MTMLPGGHQAESIPPGRKKAERIGTAEAPASAHGSPAGHQPYRDKHQDRGEGESHPRASEGEHRPHQRRTTDQPEIAREVQQAGDQAALCGPDIAHDLRVVGRLEQGIAGGGEAHRLDALAPEDGCRPRASLAARLRKGGLPRTLEVARPLAQPTSGSLRTVTPSHNQPSIAAQ